MVQLGLLGLQVLSEGLLQCRTQQWNSSVSTNREEGGGGDRGEEEGGTDGGGVGVVGHKSHHIIVTHQPKGSNKGRHAVLSPVQCRSHRLPLSEKRERQKEQRVQSLYPHKHRYKHTHSHTERTDCNTVTKIAKL